MATPTSSDSDRTRHGEMSVESSRIVDQTGNMSPQRSTTSSYATTVNELGQDPSSQATMAQQASPSLMEAPAVLSLTLHNAQITLHDDSDPKDKSVLRQKPMGEYLLQIEPASSRFPGWMIPRRYTDFEALHESIRRIAIVSGVPKFAQKYATLPGWKGLSRMRLRQDLEQYLQNAVRYEPLAESEAMKKFLEKETGLQKVPANKNVLGFQNPATLEAVGKGFINVLGTGSKGIAGGGKAVLGGVQGVFGAVATGVAGPKKSALGLARSNKSSISVTSPPRADSYGARPSQDVSRASSLDADRPPPLPTRPGRPSVEQPHLSSSFTGLTGLSQESLNLPPPPSDMLDDYNHIRQSPSRPDLPPRPSTSRPTTPTKNSTRASSINPSNQDAEPTTTSETNTAPLTEEETRVSVELMFAIITELYSLSSAWTIRLSLLAAAKTFLLRPNNPQLESIRSLLQDSVINANFSDKGLATHINKLRENALPTEEELKKWPAELTPIEKEKLRVKARKLLVEKGMPQALTSVMGAQASGEALGRVFDCLQIEVVARGLVFAILLQAIRAATQ
jgi:Sorting nexin C terminal/PX domain